MLEAAASYSPASRSLPGFSRIRCVALGNLNRYDDADRAFNEAITLAPDNRLFRETKEKYSRRSPLAS
jgi:Flp pilus assembly protein TadD